MTRRVTREIAQTGQVVDLQSEFGAELEEILFKHYESVVNRFTLDVDDQIKVREADVSIVVSEFMRVRSVEQARAITATSQKNAAEALALARAEQAAAEVALTELEIATNSGAIFRRKLDGRTTGIVMLETQAPAEASKLTRVEILIGEEPSLSGGPARPSERATKEWVNLGDSRVRAGDSGFDHLFAAQQVPINMPFNVSGEQLMFPGDTSRGATLGNVVNCRCSAVYQTV
jgi:hypothetical protein